MSYASSTIAATIDIVNRSYFLPAIQRPYVWDPEQILSLFDSLLKGYPISTFLFWEVQSQKRSDWDIYRFFENFRKGDTHNELLEPDGRDVTLVLDGQQRLTSLLIGLRGSYTVRRKYGRKDNPDAYVRLRLYLDLLASPESPDEEESDIGVTYGLKFFDREPKNGDKHHWFRLGRILDCTSDDKFDILADEVEEHLPSSASRQERRQAARNLERLYRVIWKDDAISFYIERDQSYDRVLDIFIRANDGGTKLSKSDLLLSMVTSRWKGVSAREEIFSFVDYLNEGLSATNNFDKDFIMKACLILCDLDHVYKVANFTNTNLQIIESQWARIKQSLERTVRLANGFGIDQQTLTSVNVLMPIAYYLHRTGRSLDSSSSDEIGDARKVHRFLLGSLLNGAFTGNSDQMLGVARSAMRDELAKDVRFPSERLTTVLARRGRIAAFDENNLGSLFELRYGHRAAFLALSLMYESYDWGHRSHHIDHIIPRALISRDRLSKYGLPPERVQEIMTAADRLGNLQLLLGRENVEKGAQDFNDWIRTRDPEFINKHCIPSDRTLWRPDRLPEFVAARERLMEQRILELHLSTQRDIAMAFAYE